MRFSLLNIVLIIITASSCIEPFEPNIPDGDKTFLVVDGIITDQPGPYTVNITKSTTLNDIGGEDTSISGVTVSIEEENGIIETLVETEPGVYVSNSIQGIIGKRYRLNINYQSLQYQSSWEVIESSATIDSVYYQIETKETTAIGSELTGLQFYIDSQGDTEGVTNYRYEWEETWEIGVTYVSQDDFLEGGLILPAKNPVYQCWKYQNSASINLSTTDGLSENIISGHKIGFITGEDERFIKRYTLLIKQFALDETEYLFWKFLKESNEELGSLYDKQPAKVVGNIYNIADPGDIILGYFSASGVQTERVWIMEYTVNISARNDCGIPLDTILIADYDKNYESKVLDEISKGKFFFDNYRVGRPPIQVAGALLSHKKCSDCRLKGGDLLKPEYWND